MKSHGHDEDEEGHIPTLIVALLAIAAVSVSGAQICTFVSHQDFVTGSMDVDRNVTYDLRYENMAIGHERLETDKGFMHMDLGQLSYYFKNNVTYQPDVFAYQSWKLPSLFVAEKGGDCEDYMLFALAVLDHSYYNLRPVQGTFGGEGHAFLLVQVPWDHIYLVDNIQGVIQIDDTAWNDMGNLPEPYHSSEVYDDMLNVPMGLV
jgi:hypothetical protein